MLAAADFLEAVGLVDHGSTAAETSNQTGLYLIQMPQVKR
jgi:hypothetical protein